MVVAMDQGLHEAGVVRFLHDHQQGEASGVAPPDLQSVEIVQDQSKLLQPSHPGARAGLWIQVTELGHLVDRLEEVMLQGPQHIAQGRQARRHHVPDGGRLPSALQGVVCDPPFLL